MSAVSGVKLKANCDAVNSGSFINQVTCNDNSSAAAIKTSFNNGTKLNQSDIKFEPVSPAKISIVKQETSVISNFQQHQQQQQQHQIQGQNISDVQKVLKQEQELQKQLYTGANVASGWLRVNHNNKVIYISPSGIGLASLKQVKDYLLTRGTCKCGLPFPLRVELFFNFSIEVPTVPLRTPIDSIKFDPTCQHRKKLTTHQAVANNSYNNITNDLVSNRSQQQQQQKIIGTHKRSTVRGECLLPSYVTSVNKIINQSSIRNNFNSIGNKSSSSSSSSSVMIVNSSNALSSNNLQAQIMQPQFIHQQQQQQQQNEPSTNQVVMRIIRDESGNEILTTDTKLPPWRKNAIQNQLVKTSNSGGGGTHQAQVISTTGGIPIFQINGQMIAFDQQNQQFGNQAQQIQIIEQKTIDGEKTYIRRRPPNFKEDPTGYLNQQTALLHNSITTLHSPDGSTTSSTSPSLQQDNNTAETLQQQQQRTQKQFIQQIIKASSGGGQMPSQVTTIGGQTVTHMSNGIVQIQNCDIKQHQQQHQQLKPIMIQEQIQQQQNKIIRTNPKGRPPKNAATIAKRLVAMSQESPVSSTSTASSVMKITKSSTPDITSSSSHAEAMTETMVQSSSFDGTEIMKIARNTSSTQELIRTSMTQVIAGKQTNCSTTSANAIRKPAISMMKKQQQQQQPQTILTQVKTSSNNNQLCSSAGGSIFTQSAATTSGQQQQHHQVVMTSNGQQFIVMPSSMQQPQNIMLNSNNNAVVHLQNSGTNANQRLIQTTAGQGGNFIIQTSNGSVFTTANPLTAGNFIVNGQQLNQPLVLQNGQIIQNNGNLIASPKGNILVTGGTSGAGKTIITGNNQLGSPLMGQQTVLLQPNNVIGQQPTIIHPSSFIQTTSGQQQQQTQQQQQQQKIIVNPEKKKGRKRKIPLPDQVQSVTIQQTQQQPTQQQQQQHTTTTTIQPNMIQMATPQNFHLASSNGNQQIILQNPVSILGGGQHQLIPSNAQPFMALSADGNSFVQIQNPSFNNIITTPQGMMIRAPTATATQQQQPMQKTIITNNGQQFIVQGGQLSLMNQLQPFNPMGFVVQTAAAAQQNQQQIISPIVIQSPSHQGQQIIAQPQILTHHQHNQQQQQQLHHHQSPGQITTAQGTVLTQQAQFISQNDVGKMQRKMMVQQKTQQQQQQQQNQQQKFFSQMVKPPRTAMYTTAAKNSMPTIVQSVIEEPGEEEEEEESEEMLEQEDETEEIGEEMEHEELELSFDDDDKPDMIEELHHGTSQQILHSSMLNDGQCGIMNIDDITIEMDEINDLNEYLNAIDEEDNKMSQMGLSSLQHFANSPPDTTTHSPRSPNDNMGGMHIGSERSNGSSEGNNMVSSSEADSNVVSPECHQIIDSAQSPSQYHHHNSGMQQPIFKLPMEPRSNIKSPPSHSYTIMNANIFDANNRSPLMRPDSHESTSCEQQQQSQQIQKQLPPTTHETNSTATTQSEDYESNSSSSDEITKETGMTLEQQQQKSDFDLLKESPPVNTIRPPADMIIKADDPPCRLSESPSLPSVEANNNTVGLIETNFKVGDLIWGAARGCDSLWPGKIVDGPEKEPTSSNCVWVKWFGGRQNTEMVQCSTLKSLSEGLEAHHAARKETRKGRKLNTHLERAIQKAMAELDKQSEAESTLKSNSGSKGNCERRTVTSSHKATKSRLIKIAPAPSDKK